MAGNGSNAICQITAFPGLNASAKSKDLLESALKQGSYVGMVIKGSASCQH